MRRSRGRRNESGPGRLRRAPSSRASLRLVALAGLLLLAAACGEREGAPSNLLLITVDALRADHLGAYGYEVPVSPAIDALAAQAVVFERAYVPLPETNPSLASLMTGLYPQTHGMLELRVPLPEAHETLAERLRAQGYETAGIVGQYNLVRRLGLGQGFDLYVDDFPAAPPGGQIRGKFTPWAEKRAMTLADRATAWLAEPREAPFFLWIHFMDPHTAYDPPAPYAEPTPANAASADAYPDTELTRSQIFWQAYVPGQHQLGYYLRHYDAEIRYMDSQVSRVLEGLEREGFADNTWVLLTADHGEYMGDRDAPAAQVTTSDGQVRVPHFHHGATLSEGEIRVPLLVRAPAAWRDRVKPRRVHEVVSLVDVLPTLVDVLDLPAADVDGSSFAKLLSGEAEPASRAAIVYTHESNGVALRTRGWKLVAFPTSRLAPYFSGHSEQPEGGLLFLYDETTLSDGINVVRADPAVRQSMLRRLFGTLGALRARRMERHIAAPVASEDDEDLRARLRALGYL